MNADVRLTPEAISIKAFKKVRRGYRVSEVDQFLGRVAQDLARLQERAAGQGATPLDEDPLITPTEIQEQVFNGAWYGYAMHEVDDFLDVLVAALERMYQALSEAEQWQSARRAPLQPPLATLRQLPPPDHPAAPRRPVSAHDVASKTFTRSLRGYSVDEVDQFLGRVAVELARVIGEHLGGGPPRLTSRDIASKRFTLLPRGYAMHEVDDFLAQVAAQFAERESGWSNAELTGGPGDSRARPFPDSEGIGPAER
jgi:DivIVA domain-containing protein